MRFQVFAGFGKIEAANEFTSQTLNFFTDLCI